MDVLGWLSEESLFFFHQITLGYTPGQSGPTNFASLESNPVPLSALEEGEWCYLFASEFTGSNHGSGSGLAE